MNAPDPFYPTAGSARTFNLKKNSPLALAHALLNTFTKETVPSTNEIGSSHKTGTSHF